MAETTTITEVDAEVEAESEEKPAKKEIWPNRHPYTSDELFP